RATILMASIFFYTLTSVVAGYSSANTYQIYGGRNWIKNILVTATLWPGILSIMTAMINFVAVYYSTILCRNWASQPNFPCRVNPIPRPIPEKI
ncbi:33249_t:CDS:2, partial [Racocetra persica]